MGNRKKKVFIFTVLSTCLVVTTALYPFSRHKLQNIPTHIARNQKLRDILTKEFFNRPDLPNTIEFENIQHNIEYTINRKLQDFVKSELKKYKTDFSSVIIIENESGDILTALDYRKSDNKFTKNLAFSSTHPSASLFKIITSAELLQNTSIRSDTVFSYLGKRTTLYKYQLRHKKSKWNRYQSLEKAFALSNNVIYGKAAIRHLTAVGIFIMAGNFGFNQELMNDIRMSKSVFEMPENQYNMAELASGFNIVTLISPLHAAVLPSIIANDGMFKVPRIVSRITKGREKQEVFKFKRSYRRVLEARTANILKDMMKLTVTKGTARGSFSGLKRSLRLNLHIGGKTGSITGGLPYGKRDWFSAFAVPIDDQRNGKGISIAVMNINRDKWHVRSSYLAKEIIEFYYKKISPLIINYSKNARPNLEIIVEKLNGVSRS